MSRRWPICASAAVVVVLVACGGFGGDDPAPTPSGPPSTTEAGPDAFVATDSGGLVVADADADASAPACDLGAPFGEPTRIRLSGDGTTFLATFTEDENTVYYDSASLSSPARVATFRATRTGRDAGFGAAVPVAIMNPPGNSGRPSLSGDGLTVVFFADLPVSGLRLATRSIVTEEFSKAGVPSFVAAHPLTNLGALSYDGRTLYYSGTSDAGVAGVFVSTRLGDDFPPGVPVVGLTSEDRAPHLVRDGTMAYFTRVSGTTTDIFHAERRPDGSFGEAVREGSTINTVDDEIVMFVSWDGCRLYFNRRQGSANPLLLVAAKPSR